MVRDAATGIDKAAFTRADLVEAIGARMPPSIEGAASKIDGNAIPPRYLIEGIAERIGMEWRALKSAEETDGVWRAGGAARHAGSQPPQMRSSVPA
ncbi:hypothetical protein [Mycobacterium intracellulare]|uniref:hypothetical protein n=1 Tax=Mycobacterium intracellulare TaxID=1767 RepID=UPI001EEE390F|nr:hypothetical protein [Mycobacterium intracellulare]MEE3750832.1 hypothetical protein [Mycobacterium intracellulare]